MKKETLLVSILFSIAVISFVAPLRAEALTLTPVRYEISGDPGTTITEDVTLINETKTTQTYYASFANFEAQGDTGSPTFVDPKDDLGTWISTTQASVVLRAGEQKVIPFTITIPRDAEPGGHFAALFWGTSPGKIPGEVSVGAKTGVLILLSVNGDVKESAGLVDFKLHNGQWAYRSLPVGFQYRFSNQGGDRVKPTGSVVIRSLLGWKVASVNANQYDGNVLPNTTRKFTPEWSKQYSVSEKDQQNENKKAYSFFGSVKEEWHNFALGIFQARVEASFGNAQQLVKSDRVFFIVFPVELIVVCLIIAIPLFFILRYAIRRYNRYIINKARRLVDAQK